jgi:hypothetical protein
MAKTRTADVLLVSAQPLTYEANLRHAELPLERQVEVSPGVVLCGIAPDVAAAVMKATRFRSSEPPDASDLRALYGFVRLDPPPGSSWDDDDAISKLVFLSHYVRPTEMGFEFSARLTMDADDKLLDVQPADVYPPFARAYCGKGVRRRWLTQQGALDLAELVRAYDHARPSLRGTRLGTAITGYSEMPFVYHGRPRALMLAVLLEGLVSTIPERATKQFNTRVPALATEVGLPEYDKKWADRMYKLRCRLAHGGPILKATNDDEKEAEQEEFSQAGNEMDELLRRVLRTALLDPAFQERIRDIDALWPVPPRGCPECRESVAGLLEVECPRCKKAWCRAPPASSGGGSELT